MENALQLNLFSWDRVKGGEALDALAGLDFDAATSMFEAIQARWPGHPDAAAGLAMAADWASILKTTASLQKAEAAATLWTAVKSYAFGQRGEKLRKEIIRLAIALLDGDPHFYIAPELCLGRLLLELEEHGKAQEALERCLEAQGPHGSLMLSLGNCLYRQGKKTEARLAYAKAFLLVPWEVERDRIEDSELLQAIADENVYSAAVCGWLRRILPLIDVKVESPRDTAHEHSLRVYRAVVGAEKARAKGNHDGMVAHRRLLKQLAPGVFLEYMGRM